MQGQWLSNTYDPARPDARDHYFCDRYDTTDEEVWKGYLAWVDANVIGEPMGTEVCTAAELEGRGYVGIYEGPIDPPAFAKPLAPLPEWLDKVARLLDAEPGEGE